MTPVWYPEAAASCCSVNVVDWPGANVVMPSPLASEKPAGNVLTSIGDNTRSALPIFVTVTVRVTGVPTGVVPNSTVSPLANSVDSTKMLISGAVATPLSTMSNELSSASLLSTCSVPPIVPAAAASNCTVSSTDAPGTSVVVPKPVTNENP